MKKTSVKKFSILGLILVGASAVTAAVLPSGSKSDDVRFAAGELTASTDINTLTCRPVDPGDIANCNDTLTDGINSKTTGVGQLTSATGGAENTTANDL